MKITCTRKDLLDGVQTAARAVSARATLPILGHLLIRTDKGKVNLAATDHEIGVECSAPAIIEEEGSLTAPAKILSEVLSSLPDSDITLSVDEANRVSLKCGTSDYQILGLPPEEFPMLPEVQDEASFVIEKRVLRSAIEKTIFAASQDESRASLTGILVMLDDEGVKMVSTDTHRLCLVESNATEIKGESLAIVPGRAMSELHRIVGDEEGTVTVVLSHSQVMFVVDGTRLISRLIEGQFPNFQRVIPQTNDKKLIIPTDQLMQAVRRAGIVAREDANRIIVRTADQKLTLTAESNSVGTAYEEVDVVREGDDIEMAFSARYFLDFLNVVESEAVEMLLTGNLNPALVKPQDNDTYTYVLMPMQIK